MGVVETKKRGARGRYVTENPEVQAELEQERREGGEKHRAPRPPYCRSFARARFAEALPEIAETLLAFARKGSVPHMKLLVELAGLDRADVVPRATKPRGKSLEAILKEQWEKNAEVA